MAHLRPLALLVALAGCASTSPRPQSPSEAGSPTTVTVADPGTTPPPLPVQSEAKAGTLPRGTDPSAPPPSPVSSPETGSAPAAAQPSAPAGGP